MFDRLRQFFRPKDDSPSSTIPTGQRVYAVGDVHGRLDLFTALIAAIEADDATRGAADTTIVLLGDLVDRGPDSAGVLATARELQSRRQVRIIAGNHEEMFLQSLDDADVLKHFLRYGGRETVLSYAIDPVRYRDATLEQAQQMLREAIPEADLAFVSSFEDHVRIGDYLFVHAGIRPGAPIENQRSSDLRWIREPFLSHSGDHGLMVVHGHTITDDVDIRPNRIGIDTGAYQSGRLTALGLEGTAQWLVEAAEADGVISTTARPI